MTKQYRREMADLQRTIAALSKENDAVDKQDRRNIAALAKIAASTRKKSVAAVKLVERRVTQLVRQTQSATRAAHKSIDKRMNAATDRRQILRGRLS